MDKIYVVYGRTDCGCGEGGPWDVVAYADKAMAEAHARAAQARAEQFKRPKGTYAGDDRYAVAFRAHMGVFDPVGGNHECPGDIRYHVFEVAFATSLPEGAAS